MRRLGASVLDMHQLGNGAADLLIGWRGRVRLVEVKDPLQPPSKRRLTKDEARFHAEWAGFVFVVESIEECVALFSD